MAKDHGNQIKNDDTYEALRDEGYSKEKSARIANAQANSKQTPSKDGGKGQKYEDRTKEERLRIINAPLLRLPLFIFKLRFAHFNH